MINKEINKILNIVSTDVGNLTTEVVTSKEVHIFESRLEKATDLKRLSGEQSFEMVNTGECFVVNKGEFENNSFKYDKDNFIQLLHYSIAMSMPSGNIKLATGIPAHQYNQFRDEMKNKIMMNNKINVKINNETKNILIEECMVLPEGYGIYKMTDPSLLVAGAKTIVIDIGGGSTDLAYFDENGRFTDGDSVDLGLLDLYKDVQKEVQNEIKTLYPIEDIRKYSDKELCPIGLTDEPKRQPTIDNFKQLLNRIAGKRSDLRQCNVIVAGGGAKVYGQLFKKVLPQTIINNDVAANAKAYFTAGVTKWQKRN